MMRGEREGLSVMDGTIVSSNSTLETVTHMRAHRQTIEHCSGDNMEMMFDSSDQMIMNKDD